MSGALTQHSGSWLEANVMPGEQFLREHLQLTRRYWMQLGTAAIALGPLAARGAESSPELDEAIAKLEPFFTPADDFRDVSRGKPVPHSLPEAKRAEVGLTRETWKLEVIADPESPTKLNKPLTKADNTALDFAGLLALGEKHAVRFAKVMTCLNIGCPLGMGLWEGVPLRELLWRTEPREDLRRVFYYGFHNDDPQQMFRSSLPPGRILEDPFDLPPVIVCYKLNGQWLDPERGGPVRIVVPEHYGFKSVKWLTHVVLSNIPAANDTYASGNNDLDSPLKSFAATLLVPRDAKANHSIPITGYAQVGISGVTKVQTWVQPKGETWRDDDPYFKTASWVDAMLLGPPAKWGALPDNKIPEKTLGFDDAGKPRSWPMRLAKVHWATLLPGLPAGEYTLRSRTVDDKGIGQPLPRPFRKGGHAAIETVTFKVTA
jgi:DMSO/TMAO reductase YedYZ molybdopterin-dependent catalytic subunit